MSYLTEERILCKNIKYLRFQHNLSKKEMAKKLGIGIASLSKIESGILPPRLTHELLLLIHEHFGISPHKILTEEIEDTDSF